MLEHCITNVRGWEVLDSRGNPTVAAEVEVDGIYHGRAMVPSGASTGSFEACELRDGGKRCGGKGVLTAVYHINHEIKENLLGRCVTEQQAIDRYLCQLDGTPDKSRLGANAILGVSMACARAAAGALQVPLYRYLGGAGAHLLPMPMLNVINGGRHAGNKLSFQEFMLMPVGADSFPKCMQWSMEVYHALASLLRQHGYSTGVGDEGGFAPDFKEDEEAIHWLLKAIELAGFHPGSQFRIALDPATTELYVAAQERGEEGSYCFWKTDRMFTAQQMMALWEDWCRQYPIFSIEDPLAEEDWEHYQELTRRIGDKVQLVGDDLFVTNSSRLRKGMDLDVCNAILIKVNQIGTLSEAMEAVRMAQHGGYRAVISHRSGETEDAFIADLAVAMHAGQIKTGAPCRSERTAKYNRLLDIWHELGPIAKQQMFVS